jgi:hypothetical protein
VLLKVRIAQDIEYALASGPWRLSPEEVSVMWDEILQIAEDVEDRVQVIKDTYAPWVVWEIMRHVGDILVEELS